MMQVIQKRKVQPAEGINRFRQTLLNQVINLTQFIVISSFFSNVTFKLPMNVVIRTPDL